MGVALQCICTEDFNHARLHGIESLPRANQSEVDFVRAHAIADLQSRIFSKFETDEFFDHIFAKTNHSKNPAFLGLDHRSKCAQSRKHKVGKHRLQLARRAGHQKKMRPGSGGLRDGGNIKTRRGAIRKTYW